MVTTVTTQLPQRPHTVTTVTYHISGQGVSWQVFDVLVFGVDDLCELLAIYHLLIDIHLDIVAEAGVGLHIVPDDLGDHRTPARKHTHTTLSLIEERTLIEERPLFFKVQGQNLENGFLGVTSTLWAGSY